jgi:pSer/pThr/pTyr-binding forkhead associated (FHA) protein/V8-like Glu-specific endopeptidase
MLLEVKILSGARAGQKKSLEKPVISVGRNADVDIRFDAQKDLDVSGRHAEFRQKGGGYELFDLNSTNGTYVNGERVTGSCVVRSADTVRFGANGPEVEVSFHVTASVKKVGATEERIAYAVKKQTAGLRRMLLAGLGVIALGVGVAYWMGQRASVKVVEKLQQQLADNDTRLHALANGMPGDTALANAFERRFDALGKRLAAATTEDERKQISADMADVEQKMAGMIRMDLVAINNRNAPGVALLISKIGAQAFAGTAFALTDKGLMLTNRHNVRDESTGTVASEIAIKFRNDSTYSRAHLVKIPPVGDSLDLALIQLDDSAAGYATVAGIQAKDENADEGASVALIGYPLGYDIAQEGHGENFIAKTTLVAGTVSKRTTTILQIDSYAAHGSSGSPVFSAKGMVIGVVWGGPKDAGGRIVYAVPRERIIAFLPDRVRDQVVK